MIELNCDMGESFGIYKAGNDEEIMPLIDIANVACGFHASDPNHMRKTVALAKKHGVKVGAHPSFPEKKGEPQLLPHVFLQVPQFFSCD